MAAQLAGESCARPLDNSPFCLQPGWRPHTTTVNDYRAITNGYNWYYDGSGPTGRPLVLTYSFPAFAPADVTITQPQAAASWSPLTESEKTVVRNALKQWSDVSGLQFYETTAHQGDVKFGFLDFSADSDGFRDDGSQFGGLGYSGQSMAYVSGGQLSLETEYGEPDGLVLFNSNFRSDGTFLNEFQTLALHEIGHAIGLKHPFDEPLTLASNLDNTSQTVMSYQGPYTVNQLGPLDIAAAQYLYGLPSAKGSQASSMSWDAHSETLSQTVSQNDTAVRGSGGDDIITITSIRDVVYTAGGNDRVVLTGQDIAMDGGDALDTAVTGLGLSNATRPAQSGVYTYISIGDDQRQWFVNVERLVYTNAVLALDTDGNAGEAYRMYQAAFARTPDKDGVSYWVSRVDKGLSLHDLGNAFIASAEFKSIYGASPTVQTLVTGFYTNVLGRAPDSSGLSYWTGQVQSGLSTPDLLVSFSESAENKAHVAPAVQNGIELTLSYFA